MNAMRLCLALMALFVAGRPFAEPPRPATPYVVPMNLAPHSPPEQPIPYSHKQHLAMGLSCNLCHVNPDPGDQMTFPATETCMTCHATIAAERPAIQKLAAFAAAGQSVPWARVYKVLPGVTWSHRAHLRAGEKCIACHGDVREFASMSETTGVTAMATCVSCHQSRGVSAACNVCHAWPKS